MKVEFDKEEVFTYSASNLEVGVHAPDANYHESVSVKFADRNQVYHFKEMLEFMLEKLDGV